MEKQNKHKLSDKAFVRLVVTSVLGILVCIICLCSSTFAWFSASVPSTDNKIKTSDYTELSVSIIKHNKQEGKEDVTFVTVATVNNNNNNNGQTITCEGTYTITLTLRAGSSAGYLVLSVGDNKYYTDYLPRSSVNQQLDFTLEVTGSKEVTFTVHWGIYSATPDSPIENGSKLSL